MKSEADSFSGGLIALQFLMLQAAKPRPTLEVIPLISRIMFLLKFN